MAALHPQLAADCVPLGRFPLCRLLLLDDRTYPWFILLPDRDGLSEIYQLDAPERLQLLEESCRLGSFLMREFNGDKLNLAALGNQVPQLHLHHIVRYRTDPAWPAPVWGKFPPQAYSGSELKAIRNRVNAAGLVDFEPVTEPTVG